MEESHDLYMTYAISCAQRFSETVKTNPQVGACLVYKGEIIGSGSHEKYGSAHAEVNAINAVAESDKHKIKDSTLYVTLEPCNHQGKTPPCTTKIINNNIKKVFIGTLDPNPLVAGKGVKVLEESSVQVQVGICQKECQELIEPFKVNILRNRPYICLKWAQSKDGFIGKHNQSVWLTNDLSKLMVHKWRSQFNAIMVGNNTLRIDDPFLNVRLINSQSPERVILDMNGKLRSTLNVFNVNGPKIHYYYKNRDPNIIMTENTNMVKILSENYDEAIFEVLRDLYKNNIGRLFIEGGAQLINGFIKNDLWDEARVFITDHILKSGIHAPRLIDKKIKSRESIGSDYYYRFKNNS